jgi:hypothetical protein
MRRLNAGCVMWRSSAAREKLPIAASVRKSSSQERFMNDALQASKPKKLALVSSRGNGDTYKQQNPQTEYSMKIVEIREKPSPSPARSATPTSILAR